MTRRPGSARRRWVLGAACAAPVALLIVAAAGIVRGHTARDGALGDGALGNGAARDSAALDAFDFRSKAASQVRLPHALHEISGLAVSDDGRVFAHGDERGIVYQVDYRSGSVVKAFSLGAPPVRGDFEGIAIAGVRFFLVTSTGRLYEMREGDDGAAVRYATYDTGMGRQCELEGLAYEPSDQALIVGCKRPYAPALRDAVTLFRWSVDRRASATPPAVSIPLADAIRQIKDKGFHPSAVEREPRSGHYVILAGPQRAIIEVTPGGEVLAVRPLSHRLHQQPEGLTFLGDSAVLIADEGGNGRGTLTVYPRVR